jgi:hypothetical protein
MSEKPVPNSIQVAGSGVGVDLLGGARRSPGSVAGMSVQAGTSTDDGCFGGSISMWASGSEGCSGSLIAGMPGSESSSVTGRTGRSGMKSMANWFGSSGGLTGIWPLKEI